MRAIAYGLSGLAMGTAAGFWLGLMFGSIYVDFAQISCFDGRCRAVAAGIGVAMAALGGLSGAGFGLRRASDFSEQSSIHQTA